MKRELIYVNLLSRQNEKLIEFYRDVVGFDPIDPVADGANHWFGFETGHTPFAIEPMENRDKYAFDYDTKNPMLIQFRATSEDDLREWTEGLEKKGVMIGQRMLQKSYGMVTTFADPDGNLIELVFENKK